MSDKVTTAPSASDINYMVNLFQHMTEKPVIDWESFANAAGFKNAHVAQSRWSQIKRKLKDTGAQATPKRNTANASATTHGSESKVKKATGRVGAKAKKEKNVVKSEKSDEEDPKDKTLSNAALPKFEDKSDI